MTDGNRWIEILVSSSLRWDNSKRVYTTPRSPWGGWASIAYLIQDKFSIRFSLFLSQYSTFLLVLSGITFQVNYSNPYLRFSPEETQNQTFAFPLFPVEKPCTLKLSQLNMPAIGLNLEPTTVRHSFWQQPRWPQHLGSSRHQRSKESSFCHLLAVQVGVLTGWGLAPQLSSDPTCFPRLVPQLSWQLGEWTI